MESSCGEGYSGQELMSTSDAQSFGCCFYIIKVSACETHLASLLGANPSVLTSFRIEVQRCAFGALADALLGLRMQHHPNVNRHANAICEATLSPPSCEV